jgi:endonuclease/exonuclease/phosphatase family metal-dependent hydrolase
LSYSIVRKICYNFAVPKKPEYPGKNREGQKTWEYKMLLLKTNSLFIVFTFFVGIIFLAISSCCTTFPERTLKKFPYGLKKIVTLKIVTYNVRDIIIVSNHRPERMRAIGKRLCTLDPDLVGFQESFVEEDRNILINELEKGSRLKYHHYYPSCMFGSGLLISSASPIRETSFHQYEDSNPSYKVWEGDYWAGKGVALARIELPNSNGYIDFFNTHTQAGYGNPEYKIVRERQMKELVEFMITSRENIAPAFLAGDMNCEPGEDALEILIKDAPLLRIMKIDSGKDHVFAIKNSNYSIKTLDTIRIDGVIIIDREPIPLSNHSGFMTTVQISP